MLRVPELVTVRAEELGPKALPAAWSAGRTMVAALKSALEAARGRAVPNEPLRRAVRDAIQRGHIALDGGLDLPEDARFLEVRLRIPPRTLFTEAQLSAAQLQDFSDAVVKLKQAAPGLDFDFRVVVTAEGEAPDEALLERMNEVLAKVKAGWAFQQTGEPE